MNASPLQKRQWFTALFVLLSAALLVRAVLAVVYENHFDLDWYRHWALSFQDGFFDGYARLRGEYPLDYPPVYLCFLWVVGQLDRLLPMVANPVWEQLLMKLFPILFDLALACVLYFAGRRYHETGALFAAACWAFNPAAIFNAAGWGQTDGMMGFFLLLAFWTLAEDRPLRAGALFALAMLAKLQCVYFIPVVFFFLLRRYNLRTALRSAGIALATGIAAFAPFIIGGWPILRAGALLTPFAVYFGGIGSYPYINLYAYNVYGLFGVNWVPDSSLLFGFLPVAAIGFTATAMAAAAAVFVLWRAREEHSCHLWLGALTLQQGLFILTTRQHERYQFMALPLLLMTALAIGRLRWWWLYAAQTALVLFNQFLFLMRVNHPRSWWGTSFDTTMVIGSAANILLFLVMMFFVYHDARTTHISAQNFQQEDSA